MGYQIDIRAGTPGQVVYLALELQPDVIVLDVNIKGDMHGLTAAQEIHKIAHIPIVFVSAYAEDMVENDSPLLKPYRYITKPFSLPELHNAIQALLSDTGEER